MTLEQGEEEEEGEEDEEEEGAAAPVKRRAEGGRRPKVDRAFTLFQKAQAVADEAKDTWMNSLLDRDEAEKAHDEAVERKTQAKAMKVK